ncbi:sodium:solute symporter family protein [Oscillospiraceae bacterium PP1C4]
MKVQVLPVVIVCFYLVGMLLIGYLTNKFKIKTSTDYLLGGRRLGLFFVAASLAANNVGGGSTTGVAAKAFSGWGISAGWYVLAASIAMIPLAYFAPRIRKVMAFTIPEVISRRFGDGVGTIAAVLNITSLFCLTASQILASGSVVSSLTGLNLQLCIIIAGGITLTYTVMGGLMADAVTDLIQWFIIFFGLLIAVPFIINGAGGWESIMAALPKEELNFTKIGWFTIIGLILNYFCTFLSGPEMVSRFSAAEDEETARKAAWMSAIMMALLAFIPALIGVVSLAMNPGLDGGKGTSALMFATTSYAPPLIVGLVSAAIIAATMSSADSNLLCSSTIFVKDIYQKYINPDIDDAKVMRMTRISNVVVGLLGMVIALFNISIVTLNLFAFALRSAGPFAAYGLGLAMPNATKNSGLVAVIVGSVAAVVWQLLGQPFGILTIVFGSAFGCISFVLTTWIERKMGKPPAPPAYSDVAE